MLESVLEKEVVGFRNHFLRFRIPDTWELLSKAGFKYDTTSDMQILWDSGTECVIHSNLSI
jgi:hypothetical protein